MHAASVKAKVDDASVESLNSLEEQFKAALSITRARKVYICSTK